MKRKQAAGHKSQIIISLTVRGPPVRDAADGREGASLRDGVQGRGNPERSAVHTPDSRLDGWCVDGSCQRRGETSRDQPRGGSEIAGTGRSPSVSGRLRLLKCPSSRYVLCSYVPALKIQEALQRDVMLRDNQTAGLLWIVTFIFKPKTKKFTHITLNCLWFTVYWINCFPY